MKMDDVFPQMYWQFLRLMFASLTELFWLGEKKILAIDPLLYCDHIYKDHKNRFGRVAI